MVTARVERPERVGSRGPHNETAAGAYPRPYRAGQDRVSPGDSSGGARKPIGPSVGTAWMTAPELRGVTLVTPDPTASGSVSPIS